MLRAAFFYVLSPADPIAAMGSVGLGTLLRTARSGHEQALSLFRYLRGGVRG